MYDRRQHLYQSSRGGIHLRLNRAILGGTLLPLLAFGNRTHLPHLGSPERFVRTRRRADRPRCLFWLHVVITIDDVYTYMGLYTGTGWVREFADG